MKFKFWIIAILFILGSVLGACTPQEPPAATDAGPVSGTEGEAATVVEAGELVPPIVAERRVGNEIDDVMFFAQRAEDFGRHVIVVAVQRFAVLRIQRDEVGRTEDQVVAADADVEGLHGRRGGIKNVE